MEVERDALLKHKKVERWEQNQQNIKRWRFLQRKRNNRREGRKLNNSNRAHAETKEGIMKHIREGEYKKQR